MTASCCRNRWRSICIFRRNTGARCIRRTPETKALAWQWSLWETDRLDRQIVNYVRHTTEFREAERKKEIAEAAWQQVTESFDVLEAALAKAEWLAGPAFTVGDLNVAAALYRALAIDTKKWPRAQAWLHRCWERPAAKRARAMREQIELR